MGHKHILDIVRDYALTVASLRSDNKWLREALTFVLPLIGDDVTHDEAVRIHQIKAVLRALEKEETP